MGETRRKFDADFREGAVRLVRETATSSSWHAVADEGIQRAGRPAGGARRAWLRLSHLTCSKMSVMGTREPLSGLVDHERLGVAGAVAVGPAGGAVARRAARHRGDGGIPARVQGGQAGYLDRRAPGAVRL